jgi:hypothetical protein
MSKKPFLLKIGRWDQGQGFALTVRRKRQESPVRAVDLRENGDILIQPLKPIGFYVAYSYTLFKKGEGTHDPLYAFF